MKESSFSLVTHTPSFSAFSFLMGVTFEALAAVATLGLTALAGLLLPALRSSNDFTQFSTIVETSEEVVVEEEQKEDFMETRIEKLEGPKILGNIVLPPKEEKKKPVASSNLGSADKRKRKRIRKGGLSEEEIKNNTRARSAKLRVAIKL